MVIPSLIVESMKRNTKRKGNEMYKITVPYLQKNGKTVNRLFWSDDGLNWYWIGNRKPYV